MNRTMLKQVWMALQANYTLVLITFEIFWISVFVLDRLHGAAAGGIPRFVYVNF